MKHRARSPMMSALALIGMLSLALSGCASSGPSDSEAFSSEERAATAGGSTEDSTGAGMKGSPVSESADPQNSSALAESQVIVSGSLHLSVEDPAFAAASAQEIVTSIGGRVDFASQTSTQTRSAFATYRIPAADYDAALEKLRALGAVTREEIRTEEVGARLADLDARADALRSSIERLTELMKSAGTTGDLLEAERELTSRQAELDALAAERSWYSDQVQYSTLDVEFSSSSATPTPSIGAWGRSWQIFSEGMKALGYAAIILAPWLVLASLLLVLLRILRRRWKRTHPRRPGRRRRTDRNAGAAAGDPRDASAPWSGQGEGAEPGAEPDQPPAEQDGGEEAADEA